MWKILLSSVSLLGVAAVGPAAPERKVGRPDGFRSWVHVKSAINDPEHAPFGRFRGMYHVYANAKAMEGYRSGHFPDGSIIVSAQHDVATANHHMIATQRRFVDVMEKDSRSFAATGGWGYEEFATGTDARLTESNPAASARCYACHATQAGHDSVYSRYVD